MMLHKKIKSSFLKLLGVSVLMFAFGYALVPLYDLFCEITGIGGKTGQVSNAVAAEYQVDTTRDVTVQFASTSAVNIPWKFYPVDKQITVHPGKSYYVEYYVENTASYETNGQAIPSVTPAVASKYFNKTECFCFTQQTMLANEKKDMGVQFVIDPSLPKDIHTVTLGYTFFNAEKFVKK